MWARHIARIGAMRNAYRIGWETWREKTIRRTEQRNRMIVKWILGKQGRWEWIELMRLRMRTGGGLLWTQQCDFEFHKRRRSSWLNGRTTSFSRRTLLHGTGQLLKLSALFSKAWFGWYDVESNSLVLAVTKLHASGLQHNRTTVQHKRRSSASEDSSELAAQQT
jgi:hypothetical protein